MKDSTFRADHIDTNAWEWVKGLLNDQEKLEESLRAYRTQKEDRRGPLLERIAMIDDSLKESEARLGRLLDLYLDGDFDRDLLAQRKAQFEQERTKLESERAALAKQLEAQALGEARLQSLVEFAKTIGAGIEEAKEDFDKRRAIIEAMDVTGRVDKVDGQKRVWLQCAMSNSYNVGARHGHIVR